MCTGSPKALKIEILTLGNSNFMTALLLSYLLILVMNRDPNVNYRTTSRELTHCLQIRRLLAIYAAD